MKFALIALIIALAGSFVVQANDQVAAEPVDETTTVIAAVDANAPATEDLAK